MKSKAIILLLTASKILARLGEDIKLARLRRKPSRSASKSVGQLRL